MISGVRLRWLSVWLGSLLAAVLVSWPVAAHLGTHLGRGRQSCGTVAFFNLWTLMWNRVAAQHGLSGYWDAPIFFPETGTFALSEPQPLLALAHAPLAGIFGPVVAYNLVLLLVLTLNGVCAARLLHGMRLSFPVAAAGALVTVALPYPLQELGVLQLTALFPLLLALTELYRFVQTPNAGVLWRLSLACGMTLWTCLYYAVFLALLLIVAALLFLRREHLSRRLLVGALWAALIMGAFALPFALGPYRDFPARKRSAHDVRAGSASIHAYARLDPRSLGGAYGPLSGGKPRGYALFPGSLLCLLAGYGAACEWRGPRGRFVRFCVLGLGLSLFLSFGSRLELFGFDPYSSLLRRYLPGFALLRSPYRATALVQVLLVALFGLGLARLLARWPRRTGVLITLAVVLTAIEVVPLGQRLAALPGDTLRAPWIAWLARQPPGAALMVPVAPGRKLPDYEPTTIAMVQGLGHGHPLVNGYSGFFPNEHDRAIPRLQRFPSLRAVSTMRKLGARYAVVERAWLEADRSRTPKPATLLERYRGPEKVIYELAP